MPYFSIETNLVTFCSCFSVIIRLYYTMARYAATGVHGGGSAPAFWKGGQRGTTALI